MGFWGFGASGACAGTSGRSFPDRGGRPAAAGAAAAARPADLLHRLQGAGRHERHLAGQALVEQDAQGVDVRGGADPLRLARGLLRGHVARRAQRLAGARRVPGQTVLVLQELGQAEVADLRACRPGRTARWPASGRGG